MVLQQIECKRKNPKPGIVASIVNILEVGGIKSRAYIFLTKVLELGGGAALRFNFERF